MIRLGKTERAGALAGLAGALAFAGVMALDLRLMRARTNDLRLLAGLVPGGRRWWLPVGLAMHCANGAALGVVYARLCSAPVRRPWLRGLAFGLTENTLLWPLVVVLDRLHPDIRAGRLDHFNRPVPFFQEVLRHAAYGLTLGLVEARLREHG